MAGRDWHCEGHLRQPITAITLGIMHRETHLMKSGKNRQKSANHSETRRTGALSLHDNLSRFGGLNPASRAVRNSIAIFAVKGLADFPLDGPNANFGGATTKVAPS
jgi:hypothetical protein